MYIDKNVSVIIAAGGSGSRLGVDVPKQFIDMGGRSMLSISAEPFLQNQYVDTVVFVVPSGDEEKTKSLIESELDCEGANVLFATGGADRAASVRSGLEALDAKGLVLVHDAARPYVSNEIINRVIKKAYEEGAAIPAVPVKDTVYIVDNSDTMIASEIPDRSKLFAVQTPQGFDFEILSEAHGSAKAENIAVTDDGMPVMKCGKPVYLVEGDYSNKKITTPEDLDNHESIYSSVGYIGESNAHYRVGMGFDVHRFEEGRKLILGGVEIDHDKGLLGHSDADVLTHALMDAVLGALCLGDIGGMFPDSDAQYKGISSIILLEKVVQCMKARGYELVNADLTVIAEKPKLAGYKLQIEESLAAVFGVDKSIITVKATTTEKLGFTGREEGMGAEGIVLLRKLIS